MRLAFKKDLKLSEVKKLFKTVKKENGKVVRSNSAGNGRLEISNGQFFTLVFQSNLELRKLV